MNRFRTVEIAMKGSQRTDGQKCYAVCFAGDEPLEVRVKQPRGWYTLWLQGEPFKNRIAMDAIKAARAA